MKDISAYENAIACCDKALTIDSDHLKGLHRGGLAYKELGEKIETSNEKDPRLLDLYKKAKEDLEKLTLLDRKNEIAEQKLSETIKNFYRVKLMTKNYEEKQEIMSDEKYQSKLS
jgi:tetratricopeptide (TPR) repeat protein